MADYRIKVRKLLALAESDNEHEARSALLKAKELMAEHKLTELELEDIGRREVKVVTTGYSYTMRGEWWMGTLAAIIGENYCCRSTSVRRFKGAQKREIRFIGLADDIDLCVSVFDYAVKTVRKLAREYSPNDKVIRQSYAHGFTDGVRRAFEEQRNLKEEGWGLVMTIPKEVNEYCSMFKWSRKTYKKDINHYAVSAGYMEGEQFNPAKYLA